ncbi:hypothetical protein HDU67_002028, partial [Dinochytrium kinnereticum]
TVNLGGTGAEEVSASLALLDDVTTTIRVGVAGPEEGSASLALLKDVSTTVNLGGAGDEPPSISRVDELDGTASNDERKAEEPRPRKQGCEVATLAEVKSVIKAALRRLSLHSASHVSQVNSLSTSVVRVTPERVALAQVKARISASLSRLNSVPFHGVEMSISRATSLCDSIDDIDSKTLAVAPVPFHDIVILNKCSESLPAPESVATVSEMNRCLSEIAVAAESITTSHNESGVVRGSVKALAAKFSLLQETNSACQVSKPCFLTNSSTVKAKARASQIPLAVVRASPTSSLRDSHNKISQSVLAIQTETVATRIVASALSRPSPSTSPRTKLPRLSPSTSAKTNNRISVTHGDQTASHPSAFQRAAAGHVDVMPLATGVKVGDRAVSPVSPLSKMHVGVGSSRLGSPGRVKRKQTLVGVSLIAKDGKRSSMSRLKETSDGQSSSHLVFSTLRRGDVACVAGKTSPLPKAEKSSPKIGSPSNHLRDWKTSPRLASPRHFDVTAVGGETSPLVKGGEEVSMLSSTACLMRDRPRRFRLGPPRRVSITPTVEKRTSLTQRKTVASPAPLTVSPKRKAELKAIKADIVRLSRAGWR